VDPEREYVVCVPQRKTCNENVSRIFRMRRVFHLNQNAFQIKILKQKSPLRPVIKEQGLERERTRGETMPGLLWPQNLYVCPGHTYS
jgi:hypothetical protein